jgi:hypothetical protein
MPLRASRKDRPPIQASPVQQSSSPSPAVQSSPGLTHPCGCLSAHPRKTALQSRQVQCTSPVQRSSSPGPTHLCGCLSAHPRKTAGLSCPAPIRPISVIASQRTPERQQACPVLSRSDSSRRMPLSASPKDSRHQLPSTALNWLHMSCSPARGSSESHDIQPALNSPQLPSPVLLTRQRLHRQRLL